MNTNKWHISIKVWRKGFPRGQWVRLRKCESEETARKWVEKNFPAWVCVQIVEAESV